MEYYLLTLRILHIVAGAVWTGTVVAFALFVLPTVKATGPDGGKFMEQLVKLTGFPKVTTILAVITILAGILLMWELSAGFQNGWMGSRYGIIMSIGGSVALIAFGIGMGVNMPASNRMRQIGLEVAEAGGPPSEEQGAELAALAKKAISATNVIAILLVSSVVFMSIAQYSHML